MRIATYALTIAALAIASVSQAAVTAFNIVEVPQTEVAGFSTYDITVTGSGQLTGIQMLANATAGTFYQDAGGSTTPPSNFIIGLAPSAAYDTFVGLGSTVSDGAPTPIIPGGAVNLGGASGETFDTSALDVTWAPPGDSPVNDPTDYFVARLTVSDDVAGSLLLLGSTFGEADFINPELDLADLGGTTGGGDPVASGQPASGSEISLQGAFADGSGLLAEAIMVMNDNPQSDPALEITGLAFNSNDNGLFGASFDGLKVDLTIDVDAARALPKQDVSAELVVQTNGGDLNYTLTARVPEPSTFALVGLALVGLVGYSRRK